MPNAKFHYSLSEISSVISGQSSNFANNPFIDEIQFDSRKTPLNQNSTLFFALKGSQRDGHLYISEAYKKGIRSFIISSGFDEKQYAEANFIIVENTLSALQKLAKYHRQQVNAPIVAITGSNGKTIIKEWLYNLLHSDLQITRSPKSYNSQIGVALSLKLLDADTELGIIEAGISKVGEMQNLQAMILPQFGILGHIGDAHQANFESNEQKLREKLQLFKQSLQLVHKYDTWINAIIKEELPTIESITWGEDKNADICIISINTKNNQHTIIEYSYQNKIASIKIPFTSPVAIENAMYVLAFVLSYADSAYFNAAKFQSLTDVSMRLELKSARFNSILINDAYNSDLYAVEQALDFLNEQAGIKKKVVIISDIYQSLSDVQLYSKLGLLLNKAKIDVLIGIGSVIKSWQEEFDGIQKIVFYCSTQEFISDFKITQLADSAILLKGARNFQFEKIAHILENRHHSTRLEVNLSAMISNFNAYRALLKPNTKIMVMVKAYSYGSGTIEISRVLEYQKLDFLAVAYAVEGIELKNAGISTPIMVMNPAPEDFNQIIENELMPEIYSISILKLFTEKLKEYGLRNYPVHLKLDTGMSRLGFSATDLSQLADLVMKQNQVRVVSIFSHLASADDSGDDDFSRQQIALFNQLSNQIESILGYQTIKHILNSTGIERFPDAQFDMVRLGIGLYGANAATELNLQNISSLKTIISQIKHLKAGESIGYNRRGLMKTEGRIATIPIGYADGLNRLLSNGKGSVWINGQEARIIGTICMDMTMVDITNIEAEEGDEVEIFGQYQSVFELARLTNTIAYEVLTSISPRVKRVYFYE